MEGENPGVPSTPPVETPAAGDAQPQAAPVEQPVSEDVKTPEKPAQSIPYERFQEVNNKAKQTAAELEEARQKLAELEANQPKTEEPAEPEIDPQAKKVLDAYLRSQGFVTKEQLDAEKVRIQAETDVRELKGEFDDFDKDKVLDFAKENGLSIHNKAGLKTAYQMWKSANTDPAAQEEAIRNKILAELKESGQLTGTDAERPTAGGSAPKPAEPRGLRGRIQAAVAKHRSA